MNLGLSLVIFDCDGVLVDSEPIANRVFRDQLEAVGLALELGEVMRVFVGKTKAGCIETAEAMLGRRLPEGFSSSWDDALFAALRAEVRPVAGIPEVLASLEMPYCVASNGNRDRMSLALEAAGLMERLQGRLFTASEVARPKPAPDLFIHAARTMGVEPVHCAVVEDTLTGIKAGVAAGMRVFGYVGGGHTDPVQAQGLGATVFGDMKQLKGLLGS